MARYTSSSTTLTTPPPIVGMEVSARWKRTWKGEVVMTIVMPESVIDTELYVKTPKEHISIQMDPWMSCSWKRTWSSSHPPNTQTKEKMREYRLQKAGRRISLFRTAGNFRNSHWSPRPESRCHNILHKHHHHKRTPSPTKSAVREHSPSPSAQLQWTKKTGRGDWSDSTDSAPETAAYHQESTVPDKVESTILSPESPPEYEKGLSNLDYVPKSPVYRPAVYSDEDSDQDSMLDINLDEENWDEDHLEEGQKNPTQPEKEMTMEGPSADEQARQSPSPKPDTEQPEDNLGNTHQNSEEELFQKLNKIADTVNSVNPEPEVDPWKKRRMFNSYKRLNMAYKLNQWDKTDGMTNPAEDTKTAASPSQYKDDPKDQDDQTTQTPAENGNSQPLTIPVEIMTSPPDIVNTIPSTSSKMSPDVPANFSTNLNKVAKMRTGPICYKAKLVKALTTRPRVILHRLPI